MTDYKIRTAKEIMKKVVEYNEVVSLITTNFELLRNAYLEGRAKDKYNRELENNCATEVLAVVGLLYRYGYDLKLGYGNIKLENNIRINWDGSSFYVEQENKISWFDYESDKK